MSYAYHHNLLFEDTPFDWFLVHESDRVHNSEEYKLVMNQFNNLLYNPWSEINFDKSISSPLVLESFISGTMKLFKCSKDVSN